MQGRGGEELSARPPRVNAMAATEAMRGSAMRARNALLMLADEISVIHADLGSVPADAWLVAAIDALTHAVVDVADGAENLTVRTPVQSLPKGHNREDFADRASCAAAATQLRRAQATVRSLATGRTTATTGTIDDIVDALDMLATALQDVASEPGSDRHQSVRAQAHRSIRGAHRLLQPDGQSHGPTSPEEC